MKCDSCKYKKGKILNNDKCGSGFYFEYCSKGYWKGSGLQNEDLEWEGCTDFQEKCNFNT